MQPSRYPANKEVDGQSDKRRQLDSSPSKSDQRRDLIGRRDEGAVVDKNGRGREAAGGHSENRHAAGYDKGRDRYASDRKDVRGGRQQGDHQQGPGSSRDVWREEEGRPRHDRRPPPPPHMAYDNDDHRGERRQDDSRGGPGYGGRPGYGEGDHGGRGGSYGNRNDRSWGYNRGRGGDGRGGWQRQDGGRGGGMRVRQDMRPRGGGSWHGRVQDRDRSHSRSPVGRRRSRSHGRSRSPARRRSRSPPRKTSHSRSPIRKSSRSSRRSSSRSKSRTRSPDECKRDSARRSGFDAVPAAPTVSTAVVPGPAPFIPPLPVDPAEMVRRMMAAPGSVPVVTPSGASTAGMTAAQKRVLLWGSKKAEATVVRTEAVVAAAPQSVQPGPALPPGPSSSSPSLLSAAAGPQPAVGQAVFGANRWDVAEFSSQAEKNKFLKIMGVKGASQIGVAPAPQEEKQLGHTAMTREVQDKVLSSIEEAYARGLAQTGRTTGLGI